MITEPWRSKSARTRVRCPNSQINFITPCSFHRRKSSTSEEYVFVANCPVKSRRLGGGGSGNGRCRVGSGREGQVLDSPSSPLSFTLNSLSPASYPNIIRSHSRIWVLGSCIVIHDSKLISVIRID
ncbi:hypothetical protein J6590_024869 [Homalodisca vitripennis]|nr:hypothetical protein J6590_024869 [Homalodisca vitripennis]